MNQVMMCIVSLSVMVEQTAAQDWRLLYGLRGDWKFEIGDDKCWADVKFDDSQWETIYAPAKWEDEGFPAYDGYAWYRKHFQATADWRDKSLYLRLGRIDDVDEVYVNGKLVGMTGAFPPEYETAYNVTREYQVPMYCLNIPGDNVIAVRVFDDQLEGGIIDGRLGLYEDRNALVPDIPLAGAWRFSTGDNATWKEASYEDTSWSTILVPSYWERQGFPNYDGFAWYRIRFQVPASDAGKRMILLLGNIDDFDETYLNGKLIGKTGTMGRSVMNSNAWQQVRAYTILPEQLLAGRENVIAVRVYDGYRDGGIYKGPIGIVTRERYVMWEKEMRRRFDSFWDGFMKGFKVFED
jgi:sialate O-acetylesterase